MNLTTRVAAAALTGLAILGSASSVSAQGIQQQDWNLQEATDLLNVVQSTGHTVGLDVDRCEEPKAPFGYATSEKDLVICVTRHGNDLNELADTIRHETIHLAQFCKGRNFGASIGLLFPNRIEDFATVAREGLGFVGQGYKPHEIAIENEARVLAQILEEDEVAALVTQHCGS